MNIPLPSAIGRRHSTGSAPSHVALIAEGVERWATKRDISYGQVLTRSLDALRCVVSAAIQFDIPYLTIDFRSAIRYFSTKSPKGVSEKLLEGGLKECFHDFMDRGISIRVKGLAGICFENSGMYHVDNCIMELIVCLEYEAREEICEAIRRVAQEVVRGSIAADAIDVIQYQQKSMDRTFRILI
ncbi:MAG: hypothetical protein WBO09_13985 [Methylocystis silviterrae]|uniref:hypothetical protein n=1 Tax=Methylocystis silviterrae TaxID=2743612 RepID=UPI003C77068E